MEFPPTTLAGRGEVFGWLNAVVQNVVVLVAAPPSRHLASDREVHFLGGQGGQQPGRVGKSGVLLLRLDPKKTPPSPLGRPLVSRAQ